MKLRLILAALVASAALAACGAHETPQSKATDGAQSSAPAQAEPQPAQAESQPAQAESQPAAQENKKDGAPSAAEQKSDGESKSD